MLMWLESCGSSVTENAQHQYFLSSISSRKSGVFLYPINFREGISLHIARNPDILKNNFIVHEDMYLPPKKSTPPTQKT